MKQCYIFRFPLSANSGHSYEFSSVSCDGEYGNEDAEKRALETEKKRYVDDVFCIVKDLSASLFQHINNIEPSIQFTLENQNAQGYLPFLDVQLQRSDEGFTSTRVRSYAKGLLEAMECTLSSDKVYVAFTRFPLYGNIWSMLKIQLLLRRITLYTEYLALHIQLFTLITLVDFGE